MSQDNCIYLDHGATTPVADPVLEKMLPYFGEKYGNPSSLYELGREARTEAVERSREIIADSLQVAPEEIVFTSCATESINLAIKGSVLAQESTPHLITTEIEHHAVLHSFQWLENRGYEVTYLETDENGLVDPDALRSAIRDDTFLASVMYANNEIGTIEPIEELGNVCHQNDVLFHTDAVQAYGKFPLMMDHIDMLSASGHKIYGPKGVGFLYVRDGISLSPLLSGGGHEDGRRSGTENTAGIVGLAAAVELMEEDGETEIERQQALRDQIIEEALEIPDTVLNGPRRGRLPNNVNLTFKYIEGESIVMKLDDEGIAASTGSACSSPSLEPSHVLLAIGLSPSLAHGSLRLTLGRGNTEEEVEYFLDTLPQVVSELREISPFKDSWEG